MRAHFEGDWRCEQPLLATGLKLQVPPRVPEDQLMRLLGKLPSCDLEQSFPALAALLTQRSDMLVVEYQVKRRRRQRLQA